MNAAIESAPPRQGARWRLNLRAELRRVLLAAGESCWISAVLLTLGTLWGLPQQVSPFGILFVFWMGLVTGRILPRQRQTWRVLQLLTVLVALLTILAAMRFGFYGDSAVVEFGWLGTYLERIRAMFERVTAEELSTIALLFAFVRGLGFAQRPLTLWVVGFDFRLGIVVFFGTAIIGALAPGVNLIPLIFAYFAISLLAISLARIEEAGQERPLGFKWALVLGGALALSLMLGLVLTRLFTLDTVNALFRLLSPLGIVFAVLVTLIAIPFFYLFGLLLDLVAPLLQAFFQRLANLLPGLNVTPPDTVELVERVSRQIELLVPYLRLVGVILVVFLGGWLVARALNRRLHWHEDDMYEREALEERDALELERGKRPRPARPVRREIHDENVRRIYAALQAEAETLGLKRREAETPLEYLPRLIEHFPGNGDEFRVLTDAYVAVHYAQVPATDAQVNELRAVWRGLKQRIHAQQRHMSSQRR